MSALSAYTRMLMGTLINPTTVIPKPTTVIPANAGTHAFNYLDARIREHDELIRPPPWI